MRIISKERDYYDGIQKMGVDNSVIYFRKPESFDSTGIPALTTEHEIWLLDLPIRYIIGTVTVGFCGYLYLVFDVRWSASNKVFTNLTDANEFIISKGKTRAARTRIREYFESQTYMRKYFYRHELNQKKVDKFLDEQKKRNDSWFIKINSPAFTIRQQRRGKVNAIKNPILNKVEFARVKDPYTAYQEIMMFLSGPLVKQMDPNINIDDETMAKMKGFNKESFRMDSPGKKKKRRKK